MIWGFTYKNTQLVLNIYGMRTNTLWNLKRIMDSCVDKNRDGQYDKAKTCRSGKNPKTIN